MLVEISEPAKGKARQFGGEGLAQAGTYVSDFASGVKNAVSSVAQGALNAFDKANQGNVFPALGSTNTGSGNSGSGNTGNMGNMG